MRSLWSRVGTGSITMVRPGVFRPASSTADLTWAEATGRRYSIEIGAAAPITASGSRLPARVMNCAPISSSGRVTRAIGRLVSEASPVKKLVIGWLATSPISRRTPVPALPRSSTRSGSASPPMPTPSTVQMPSSCRSTRAPRATIAAPVLRTSSPSSNPRMVVRPTASPPRMSARCDMDLSPGIRTRPVSGPPGRPIKGIA